MDAGHLVRTARRRAGLTQAALAERAGVSQPVIAAYERSRREPTLPTLRKLVRAAGFDLDLELVPARTLPDADAAGRTLVEALDLASAIPRRRRPEVELPRFGRRAPA